MKVAVVGPVYPFRGGIAHYTSMLAQTLIGQGHEVLVVSYRRQYPRWLYPGDSDRDPSQPAAAWRVEAEFLLDTLWPPTWGQAVRRLKAFEPDLVVLQWWTTFMAPLSWALARALRRAARQVVFVIHNVLPHEPQPGDKWLAQLVLREADACVVQTAAELGRLHALLPDLQACVVAHPNYTGFANGVLPQATARRQLGLPEDAKVILFFGIVRPYKGLRVLLQALSYLHGSGQAAHLMVAGEFWEDQDAYRREIEALGLAAYVHLTGSYVPNEAVGQYFAAADVFAAPYVSGTASGAVTVAISFGLPVVCTRPEDVAGLTQGPLGAQVVPPNDPAALAAALSATLLAGESRPPAAEKSLAEQVQTSWHQLAHTLLSMAQGQ